MLILLPPSETKRDGGPEGSSLDLAMLSFPELQAPRATVLSGLRAVSRSVTASEKALRLGRTQRAEIDRNRAVAISPVLPALDRYTGVLYDALGAASLSDAGRSFAHTHLAVHSALFGLVRALDPIPAYRLSHDSALPGISMRRTWRAPIADLLEGVEGLILDLRSEAYAQLGPAPPGSRYLRVLSETDGGRRVALSHFNKSAKGSFARSVIESGLDHDDERSLIEWARSAGWRVEHGAPGELDLVV